jgi:hypothetical protein
LEKSLLNGLIIPGVDIKDLANLSKNLANLVDLTLEKQKICKYLPIFQLKQEKICQIKALPPFKWKPIDCWLVYIGDNHITKIA